MYEQVRFDGEGDGNMTPLCDFKRADELAKPHYPDGAWQCVKCGFVAPFDQLAPCPKFGIGDRVEQVIKLFLPGVKTCGGCKKRRRLLNGLSKEG